MFPSHERRKVEDRLIYLSTNVSEKITCYLYTIEPHLLMDWTRFDIDFAVIAGSRSIRFFNYYSSSLFTGTCALLKVILPA